MPIEVGIWRLGDKPEKVVMSTIDSESRLEDALVQDISILSDQLILIGRQVSTSYGKFIDMLAMDMSGNLSIIELKKNRTPREVVAQLLDYASWIQSLSYEEIAAIYSDKNAGKKLEEGFDDSFGMSLPEQINQQHELIVVASEIDTSTERIINYLTDNYGVPINAVFFRFFRDEDRGYLARTWLIEPEEAERKVSKSTVRKGSEAWNGRDFYVSLGDGEHRSWNDCQKYGFVSGGGGKWYSQTLKLLFPGSRVFVNIPKAGYVGIGLVKDNVVPVKDFKVLLEDQEVPILSAPLAAPNMGENSDNLDLCEYVVRVEWLKTIPKNTAYWEKGLFAIQHTACRMTSSFTIEKLSQHFGLQN
ncbi:endonuclease NucS domain-containing protein [Leptolyngbya sp. PCC 6406]|uniref:endonuclease NucS domain-containing protein n=1 Tax=Leptolyngbya sp. PCC 6406 TaxID=1173264 RepID=UPI0002ACDBB7|nr:endonuclease NucS domain-containing protein [Leptolyngbya sp. PCC 6406]